MEVFFWRRQWRALSTALCDVLFNITRMDPQLLKLRYLSMHVYIPAHAMYILGREVTRDALRVLGGR